LHTAQKVRCSRPCCRWSRSPPRCIRRSDSRHPRRQSRASRSRRRVAAGDLPGRSREGQSSRTRSPAVRKASGPSGPSASSALTSANSFRERAIADTGRARIVTSEHARSRHRAPERLGGADELERASDHTACRGGARGQARPKTSGSRHAGGGARPATERERHSAPREPRRSPHETPVTQPIQDIAGQPTPARARAEGNVEGRRPVRSVWPAAGSSRDDFAVYEPIRTARRIPHSAASYLVQLGGARRAAREAGAHSRARRPPGRRDAATSNGRPSPMWNSRRCRRGAPNTREDGLK